MNMNKYYVEKFYDEYALKKENTIIAVIDTGTNTRKVCDLLNKQEERINELELENAKIYKELNYLQDSISNAIKHQKTELQQKTLQGIIEDYNEWMLGHKKKVE